MSIGIVFNWKYKAVSHPAVAGFATALHIAYAHEIGFRLRPNEK